MSFGAQIFGRDSLINRVGNVLGLGIPGWLDRKFGPPETEGPRLSDLSIQTSTYGADIARVYGTVALAGNITWLEGGKLKEVVKKNDQGGKGGASSEPDKTYTYFATFHLMLCLGEIQGIRRIWCSDKLIYDAGSDDLETIIASNDAARKWTLYRGTDDQMPDPRYEADVGVENASANRGIAYLAFRDFNLTDYGNSLQGSQFKVEVVSAGTTESPTFFYSRDYEGAPVYSDGAIFQTAEYVSIVRVPPAVNWFDEGYSRGTIKFRTYSHAGQLIREELKTADIWLEYGTSSSLIKVHPLRGVQSQLFMVNRDNNTTAGDLEMPPGYEVYIGDNWDQGGSMYGSNYRVGGVTVVTRSNTGRGRFWLVGGDSMLPIASDTGSNYFGQAFCADPLTGRLYVKYAIGNNYYLGEIDTATGAMLWSTLLGLSSLSGRTEHKFYCYDGSVIMQCYGQIRVYDVSGTGAVLKSAIPASPYISDMDGYAPGFGITEDGGDVYRMDEASTFSTVDLSDVLTSEVELSNLLVSADMDVSLIDRQVRGYRVAGGTIRSALEPLATAFQFDVIQSGYKLKFIPRGGASVLTVPYADLGATSGDSPDEIFAQSREMDPQLPAKTTVSYLDPNREYEVSEQYAARINTEAVNEVDVELALVMEADEGAGIAEILQNLAWLQRTDFAFSLPPTYQGLEPCDVITVNSKSAVHEVFISEVDYTQDGRVEVKGLPSSAAVYIPNASGGEGNVPPGTIGLPGPSLFLPLDIPLVDEISQNAPGFVGAMTGYTDGWPGATVFRSADEGQTWTDVQGYSGKGGIGSATNSLAANPGYLIDQSTLNVLMISGDPEGITYDQLLTGYNYAAYGVDGRWEIVRFQNAALQGDGSYALSGFVRGDKGTEWATGLHQPGDWFVLLDDPDNAFIGVATETIGLDRLYRGITQRASIETGTDVEFSYDGVNLEPLSPVDARATRDGSGNLSATFVRRSRLGSTWWGNGVEAPVGEATQAYQIDVMNGAAVVRTIEVATPAFSYSAANQATDFGSTQSSILFRIYQLSELVGRGFVREVTL